MNLCAFKQRKRLITSFIPIIMMAAFALKAVIPAGFMPESKNGFMAMVICSGMGEKTVFVPNSETPPSEHHNDTTAKEVCAYQVVGSAKILLDVRAFTLALPSSQNIPQNFANEQTLVSSLYISFIARAPPVINQA